MRYIILFTMFLILSTVLSCVSAEVKTPDGMLVKYSSYGDKEIDSISFEKNEKGFKFKMKGVKGTEQDIILPGSSEIK